MASAASQIILHPASSSTLKILGTTVGRDKVRKYMFPTHAPPLIRVREPIGLQGDTVLCTLLRVVSHYRRS